MIAFAALPLLPANSVVRSQPQGIAQASKLTQPTSRASIDASPQLPFCAAPFRAIPPSPTWISGTISGLAFTRAGQIAEIQRGSPPAVLVLDAAGHVRQRFGEFSYVIPHTVRVDPQGNIWTVDAGSSRILKYSWSGKLLLSVNLTNLDSPDSNQSSPPPDGTFIGATDIAFAPDGNFFVADGYRNARILEFSPQGQLLRQWGQHGTAPGQFNLPHSLQFSGGELYVADRENDRIQVFSRDATPLRQFNGLGRVYSIRVIDSTIWASVGAPDQEPGTGDTTILKLDGHTGHILGHFTITEPRSGHALDLSPDGEPVITSGDHLVWLHRDCTSAPVLGFRKGTASAVP